MTDWKSVQDRVRELTGEDIPVAVLEKFVDDTRFYKDNELVERLYLAGLITYKIRCEALSDIAVTAGFEQLDDVTTKDASGDNPYESAKSFVYGQIRGKERIVLAVCAIVSGAGMSYAAVIKVRGLPRKDVIKLMIIAGITFIAKEIGSDIVVRRNGKRMLYTIMNQHADYEAMNKSV